MTLKYSVLCLLALLIGVLLAFKNYETWTSPIRAVSEKAAPKKSGLKPETLPPQREQKDQDSIASYISIAEKNPFHPERTEFPVLAQPEAPKEVKKAIVRPQVALYGVTIAGDYRSASISYPGRPLQKGERELVNVKIGDRVGEYKLAKIMEDRVVLEASEDGFEVLLYDAKAPKKRVYARTETKPATVTSTLPGSPEPAKPGGPAAAVVPAGSAAPGVAGMPRTPARPGIGEAPTTNPSVPAATPTPAPSSHRTRRFDAKTPGGE